MPTEAARDRKSTEPARGPRLSKPRRVRTPTVLQMEAVECGAAALAIVLGYYRRFVPLEELRVACGVSRDGSKASNILKAARTYGLHAKGYKKDIPAAKELQPPFIAFWNFNHFVVVNGFGNKQVFLNDPGVGPRTVTDVEFDLAFTGVVLVFETTPEFRREGAPPRALAALLSRLKGSRVALFYIVLATFALALPNLIVPIFSRLYIDDVLIAGKRTWLGPLMVAMASAAVIKAVLVYLQQSVLLTTETKVSIISSARFFWHVLMMPMEFFSQRYAGEVTSRIQLNDRLAALLSGELASSAANLLFIGIFAFLMARFDIVLTLIAVCAACLNLAALQYIARRRRDQNIRLMQEKGKLIGITMSTLQMIETVKSTGSESDYFSRWAGYQAKVVNAEQALGYSSHVLGSVPILLTALTAVAVLGIGGFRVINGALTIGALIALQALIASFMDPVNSLINLGATIQEVQGDLGRLDDVMRYPPDPIAVRSRGLLMTEAHDRLEGYLELKNITFGYSRLEPALLNNFSLSLRPGQRVALIGGSGSGKSTVAKLVAGLYEPWSGEILFDGLRRADIRKDVLTSSVSLVDQEVFLFEGSVRRNLTLWDDSVEEAVLLQAAEDAVIHEDIVGRLGGYDSLLEEEGRNFSGGQRQRMEIARALMGGPRLLILDEATSALDPRVEEMISEGLRRRGCSCLIVAHRLSTIRDADEIIVLDRGAIVQRGTHEEMRAVPGPYATLLKTE